MDVSVTKTDAGYLVKIGNKTITLPLDSKSRQTHKKGEEYSTFGTPAKYLQIDPYSNEIDFVKGKNEPSEEIVTEEDADDEEREQIVSKLTNAWAERDKPDSDPEGGRRLRLKRKTRRSKGKRRYTKRR